MRSESQPLLEPTTAELRQQLLQDLRNSSLRRQYLAKRTPEWIGADVQLPCPWLLDCVLGGILCGALVCSLLVLWRVTVSVDAQPPVAASSEKLDHGQEQEGWLARSGEWIREKGGALGLAVVGLAIAALLLFLVSCIVCIAGVVAGAPIGALYGAILWRVRPAHRARLGTWAMFGSMIGIVAIILSLICLFFSCPLPGVLAIAAAGGGLGGVALARSTWEQDVFEFGPLPYEAFMESEKELRKRFLT